MDRNTYILAMQTLDRLGQAVDKAINQLAALKEQEEQPDGHDLG